MCVARSKGCWNEKRMMMDILFYENCNETEILGFCTRFLKKWLQQWTTSPSCLCSVPRPACIKGLDIPSAPYLTLAELFMPHNNGMNHSNIAVLWEARERKRNQGIQFYAFQMIMMHFPNMQERFMNKGWKNAFIVVCWHT